MAEYRAGQELPGAGDVEDIYLVADFFRQWRVRRAHAHNPNGRLVQQRIAGSLNNVDGFNGAVPTDCYRQHQRTFHFPLACFCRVVKVADSLNF